MYDRIPKDSVLFEIIRIARSCGAIMLEADRTSANVLMKSGKADFVTEYDKMIEKKLKTELPALIPGSQFMGEEGDSAQDMNRGFVFVVDPIDGTTNFIRDYHYSCVSIGLLRDGEQYIGVVYNPYTDEVFAAQKGCGAYCNGREIHTTTNTLSESVVIFGSSPYYPELHRRTFDVAFSLFERGLDIRRSGSAALDLCSVAAGRGDMFFELILYPWDFAAGSLLITEAGGMITQTDGSPLTLDKPCSVFASNGIIPVSVLGC